MSIAFHSYKRLHTILYFYVPDAYEAEQLLKEVDIHSVTGVLKLYLRELPEALFTDALYPELLKAWGATQVSILISLYSAKFTHCTS